MWKEVGFRIRFRESVTYNQYYHKHITIVQLRYVILQLM
ncbi:hypothetical protein DDD_2109 [Nonlabens dokdonensis DSW-6]|uniref:Uncharacterized protein n=1 Tax=Nonlabens dokdonensis (strain DSM 17205 / KCTC 12402 / DSW-6) TaxID=592029 RepID=L7WBI2_NONDD|nr:hypothetical protein DDD_2109 [Nonlabens dokdonensis DSW-6]